MVAGDDSAQPRRVWRPLLIYLAIQIVAIAVASLIGRGPGAAVRVAIVLTGTIVFTVGVARHRPQPRTSWQVLVVAALSEIAAAVSITTVYGLGNRRGIVSEVPVILIGLTLPLFAIGLLLLSRASPRGGATDLLDSVLTALGGFLLVWTFLVEPSLSTQRYSLVVAVAYAGGTSLIVAVAVKLVFGGAWRDGPIRVLLYAMVLLVSTSVLALVPALASSGIRTSTADGILWTCYGTALGAVGLHPGLAKPRHRRSQSPRGLSGKRVVLFLVLAMIAPIAWAVQLLANGDRISANVMGFAIPIGAAALFLLLLVLRLGLIGRVAQIRATELARRSAALSRAVSEQDELQQQLAYRAMHDPLTGLANRTVLAERLNDLFRRGRSGCHAILLFDLDGFKDINDTLGHPTGDDLLMEAAHRLREAVPASSTLARLGGDEFVVVLENTDRETARARAGDLQTSVNRAYDIGGRELYLTTSVGILTTDPARPTPTPSDMLRDADLALYAAKESGKNRIVFFEPRFRDARLRQSQVSTGLRHALSNEEFVLHYQPMVELVGLRIHAVEALLRWHPHGGRLISPDEFVPIAEQSGLILDIGDWVLRTACRDARRWFLDHGIQVSVNASGRQLDEADYADTVLRILEESGLPGSALIIEITESTLVTSSHTPRLHQHLRRLRGADVKIAIDDFGTGYSSLSYVADLPIDIVKIDKSFTQAPGGPGLAQQDWAFTKAILQLVESLDMLAVAEGVETPAQAEALRVMRCPIVQGFHFARPVPAEAIDRTLQGLGPALIRTVGVGSRGEDTLR